MLFNLNPHPIFFLFLWQYVLADVEVARVSDFGKNDTTFHGRTHLGHVLQAGDSAFG